MNSLATQMLIKHIGGENAANLEDDGLFLINTNYIGFFDKGLKDPECRKMLIEYFKKKEKWLTIKDHFKAAYEQGATFEAIKKELDYVNSHKYHFAEHEGKCLDLTESITLHRKQMDDRDYFAYFFAYRLSKRDLNRIKDFLGYSLNVHFENDIREFIHFLEDVVIPMHKVLIGSDRVNSILKILNVGNPHPLEVKVKSRKIKIVAEVPLSDFFNEGYAKQENAIIFRTEIVKKIIVVNGKRVPGAKGILNKIVGYLYRDCRVWRPDLTLPEISKTLQVECGLDKLNDQFFQTDRMLLVGNLKPKLDGIKWIRSSKNPLNG